MLATLALTLVGGSAAADCQPLRFGYLDQQKPPYYMGSGSQPATPPGIGVELIQEAAKTVGCTVQLVRLPVSRLLPGLADGKFDAMTLETQDDPSGALYAFPLDKEGHPDRQFSTKAFTVTFVRTSEHLPADTKPIDYFRGRRMGANLGGSTGEQLRSLNMDVDDGAANIERNLEKLLLGRIDGFAIKLVHVDDLDKFVQRRFGGTVVRLPTPLHITETWLAFNKAYYANNRQQVDAMWRWLSAHRHERLAQLLKKYNKQP